MRERRDEAFEALFREVYPRAVAAARRIVGQRELAEDIAAEALARTYVRWSKVRDLPWVHAHVLRSTINLAIDAARRRTDVPVGRTATGDAADAVATRLALVAALRSLPPRQREAVALRYLGGLSEQEVADALGCASGTVKSHLHRGVAALRGALGADLEEVALVE